MKKELLILHVETLLLLKAKENVESFYIYYSMPIDCEEQIPLFFEIRDDSSKEIINYSINDDKNHPNKLLKIQINQLKKGKIIRIHFDNIVMIINNEYNDLPKKVNINSLKTIPKNIGIWLVPTNSIQSDNFLIKIFAHFLKGFSTDIICISERIIKYTPAHRFELQLLRYILETNPILRPLFLRKSYYTGLMDAFSYLLFGGLCAGQTNFSVALLRELGIPSRILIVRMFNQKWHVGEKNWNDSQHYLFEIYCPGYGWIKCNPGQFAFQPNNYVVFRVIYPEDENIAGNGLSYYGGMCPWFWITNNQMTLVFPEKYISYKKPKGEVSGVPAIRIWTENKLYVEEKKIKEILPIARKVWILYLQYFGKNMITGKKHDYNKIITLQKNAIDHFIKADIDLFNQSLYSCFEYLNHLR